MMQASFLGRTFGHWATGYDAHNAVKHTFGVHRNSEHGRAFGTMFSAWLAVK